MANTEMSGYVKARGLADGVELRRKVSALSGTGLLAEGGAELDGRRKGAERHRTAGAWGQSGTGRPAQGAERYRAVGAWGQSGNWTAGAWGWGGTGRSAQGSGAAMGYGGGPYGANSSAEDVGEDGVAIHRD